MAGKPKQTGDPLEDALAILNGKFGAGTIYEVGKFRPPPVDVFSTGSLSLDAATGIGGIPRGRVTEIFGPFSSGKTTIALHVMASAQKLGFKAVVVDAEHALDPEYAGALGMDVDAMILSQPDSGEQALEVVETLVLSAIAGSHIGVIVIDSVAALVPQAEIDGEMGQAHIGLQARLISQALRKLTAKVAEAKIACIFINQLRDKVGFVLGPSETTTGGRALPFYSSMRLDARPLATLKHGSEPVGRRTRVKVAKNKLSSPFKTAEFDIIFGRGINRAGELLDLGTGAAVLRKTGTHYFYGEHPLGNGREAARDALQAEPELADSIEAEIRKVGLAGLLKPSSSPSEDAAPVLPGAGPKGDPFDAVDAPVS